MWLRIELTEGELKALIIGEMQRRLGDVELDRNRVRIEVKSKQNYRSEWEVADFRAHYEGDVG